MGEKRALHILSKIDWVEEKFFNQLAITQVGKDQTTKMVGQLKIWAILTQWIEQVSFSYVLYTGYQILFYHL